MINQLEECEAASVSTTGLELSAGSAKSAYQRPTLTTYGRFQHLTMTVSGGGGTNPSPCTDANGDPINPPPPGCN